MPSKALQPVGSGQRKHPDVAILQTDDAEILDFVGGVGSVSFGPGASLRVRLVVVTGRDPVKGLDVDALQATVVLDDVVDTVEVVLGSGDEDTLFEEVALEHVLSFRPPVS